MMELTVAQANTEQKPKGKIIGKILDKVNNDPIIGAIVLVDGTTIGVQTNFDGQYELNLPQGAYKILVKVVEKHPEIETSLWTGALMSAFVHMHVNTKIPYKEFCKIIDGNKIIYKKWWDQDYLD